MAAAQQRPGTLRVGSIFGVDVYVSTTWFLIAGLLAFSLSPAVESARPGLGGLKYVAAAALVVLLYLSILVHELSHLLMARRFGIPANSITLSFIGGATELEGETARPRHEFWTAFVGPVTSLAIGVLALPLAFALPDGLLTLAAAMLAGTNLFLGVLNLVPGLPLDGGRVLRAAVWAGTGDRNRATTVAGWGGRIIGLLIASGPLWLPYAGFGISAADLIILPVVGFFIWSAASAYIRSARIRARLPRLRARELARRMIAVPHDLPLAEAVRRAQDEAAGGILTLDAAGHPAGIVVEAAVKAVPAERQPWTTVGQVARPMAEGLRLPADSSGEALIRAMQKTPATEYLLVELDGSAFGILVTADVDRAFSATRA